MELDLEGQLAERAYPILASLVTPRPIAFVTTVSPDGKVNAAPFSFFNLLGANPPILAFAPGDREDGTPKDTAQNIRLTHEFVVNLVDGTRTVGRFVQQRHFIIEVCVGGVVRQPSASLGPFCASCRVSTGVLATVRDQEFRAVPILAQAVSWTARIPVRRSSNRD